MSRRSVAGMTLGFIVMIGGFSTFTVNDWPDREAAAILSRCAEAARPGGGRVVVLGSVSPDGETSGLMVEMVLVGGKHRSVAEFRELAREAGLNVVAAERQASGHLAVECRAG